MKTRVLIGGMVGGLAGMAVATLILHSLSPGSGSLKAEQARSDIRFLFATIEKVHPDPYAITRREDLLELRQEAGQQLPSSMEGVEFFRRVAPLVAALGDGHTGLAPPRQAFRAAVGMDPRLLPLVLDFEGDRVRIRSCACKEPILPGTELIEIDGRPVQEALAPMEAMIPGERLPWKRSLLAKDLAMYWWLAHGDVSGIELTLRTPSGETREVEVEGVSIMMIDRRELFGPDPLDLEMLEGNGALLTVATFQNPTGYDGFLQSSFEEIKKAGVEWLIIDLRENSGGNSRLGDQLLQFLTDQPFRQYSRIDLKVSKEIRPRYPGFLPENVADGQIYSFEVPFLQPREEPLRFQGRLFVLIGPKVFSSGTSFASAVKDFGLGTLVGEPTGGNATSFGDLYQFELPHSGLKAYCSHKRFVRPDGDTTPAGVKPDIEVPAGKALEAAMAKAKG